MGRGEVCSLEFEKNEELCGGPERELIPYSRCRDFLRVKAL